MAHALQDSRPSVLFADTSLRETVEKALSELARSETQALGSTSGQPQTPVRVIWVNVGSTTPPPGSSSVDQTLLESNSGGGPALEGVVSAPEGEDYEGLFGGAITAGGTRKGIEEIRREVAEAGGSVEDG